ncbi:myb/SANT-like DNA-binding domain-containing protein 4 [Patella vulgata]|uniref:myb/SANT-like DNA-binding domain-containing protein 4 n=1 Tax=Patella vulgata TaxID=6465 RepID=UPI0024A8C84B|nr:myb/SANT-like DNA-binding domain-containing protein 4 [Patella vulgata]
MEGDGRKRAANWSNAEEMVLIEECTKREETLFGKIKGCGALGKISKLKENGWQEVVDALNSQFITKKREIVEVKKKYHNIKQRSKEKLDQMKRPKTGGGPNPSYTDAEDLLLNTMEGRPQIEGLSFGIDTDDLQILPPTLPLTYPIEILFEEQATGTFKEDSADKTSTIMTPTPKRQKVCKGLTQLEEENIRLDNERIKLEIEKLKQQRRNLEIEYEILCIKRNKLNE